nr:HypC/HybG/HupF family hydrogenase formation chaperone [candidate division Zixibacteria bacterium]
MCLAIPGRIISLDNLEGMMRSGRVDFGGIVKQINLAFVPEAGINDYVIVHAGFAISVLDEEEAARTLEYIAEIKRAEESGDGEG